METLTFTRDTVRRIQQEAVAALQEVAKRHGLAVAAGRGKFDYTNASLIFEFSRVIAETGAVETREAVAFRREAPLFGFQPTDLGRTFRQNGDRFRITGLNTNARRMPIQAERVSDGKRFKFNADGLAARLEA